jgi:hypothetical protein
LKIQGRGVLRGGGGLDVFASCFQGTAFGVVRNFREVPDFIVAFVFGIIKKKIHLPSHPNPCVLFWLNFSKSILDFGVQ